MLDLLAAIEAAEAAAAAEALRARAAAEVARQEATIASRALGARVSGIFYGPRPDNMAGEPPNVTVADILAVKAQAVRSDALRDAAERAELSAAEAEAWAVRAELLANSAREDKAGAL